LIGSTYGYATDSTGNDGTEGPKGIIEYTSVQSTKTFSVLATRNSGGGDCSVFVNDSTSSVGISLIPLDQALPLPNVLNQVTSPTSGGVRIASAYLDCDASSSIYGQDGTWISSIGNRGAVTCTVTFVAGTFSAQPRCTYTTNGASSLAAIDYNGTTSLDIYAGQSSGSYADHAGTLICIGAK
jgi:hypothetical protein